MSISVIDVGIDFVLSFRIFDVVTGLIAKRAGVELRSLPGLFNWLPVADICQTSVIAVHGLKPLHNILRFFEYRRECCLHQTTDKTKCPFNGNIPNQFALKTPKSELVMRTFAPITIGYP
jgi:hypothetical protein